ncbi:PAS domain S-box protein [Pedobacter duraquae]|uniref:histidine kinase n=1 Tax=Pedobacter duraquae TaxID=425511 RepID=A0A4R6ILB3_9SPHI|nr:PAS domain S-box protein [Pedobacter duraquae]TDO22914.1 PAS domain S-box-containing protein [Pedobacter duraquae]
MSQSPHLLSNEQLIEVFALTKTATAIHVGEDAVIQLANDAMLRIWGKDKSVIGKSLEDALPELRGQPFIEMFKRVWLEGLTISGTDTPATLEVDGVLTTFYFEFEYRAIKDAQGKTICVLHTAIDISDRILGLEAIKRAEEKELALEKEQALNEELASTNEELAAINEEFQQSQENLHLLNTELEARVEARVRELRETEERFRTMAEGTDILIAVGDETGEAIYFNKAWEQLTGRPMQELLKIGWVDLIHSDDRDQFLSNFVDNFNKRAPFSGEFRVMNHDGEYRWLLASGPPRFFPDGSFAGYISSCIDITDRKKEEIEKQDLAEELIAMNEEMTVSNEELLSANEDLIITRQQVEKAELGLRLAIDAARLGAWQIDPATKHLTYNKMLAKLFGYEGAEPMTYEQAIAQVTPEYRPIVTEAIEKAIANQGNYDVTYAQNRFNDGEVVWLRSLGRISQDDAGAYTIFSGFVMDITELKQDEQRKNDFIGMVSHELKTPLTSLNGYIQILQNKARKGEDTFTVNALEVAGKQVRKMTTMINGFLNISRLESGKIILNKSHFRLDELINASVKEMVLMDSSHSITYKIHEPITIVADYDKISSVISNLLSNAIKYSPNNKEIEISCAIVDNAAVVSVRDQGMGIAEKDMGHLFDRYYRVESNHTISGFGIGLYLSAEIVERHTGSIWAESEVDKGSTFYFSVPLA